MIRPPASRNESRNLYHAFLFGVPYGRWILEYIISETKYFMICWKLLQTYVRPRWYSRGNGGNRCNAAATTAGSGGGREAAAAAVVAAEAEASVALLNSWGGEGEGEENICYAKYICLNVCLFGLQTSNTVQCWDATKERDKARVSLCLETNPFHHLYCLVPPMVSHVILVYYIWSFTESLRCGRDLMTHTWKKRQETLLQMTLTEVKSRLSPSISHGRGPAATASSLCIQAIA